MGLFIYLLSLVNQKHKPLVNENIISFNFFFQSKILGGSLQDLLTPPQRLIKAKSESSVASLCSATTIMSTGHDHDGKLTKNGSYYDC